MRRVRRQLAVRNPVENNLLCSRLSLIVSFIATAYREPLSVLSVGNWQDAPLTAGCSGGRDAVRGLRKNDLGDWDRLFDRMYTESVYHLRLSAQI